MQDVRVELPALINALLQSPAGVQRGLIERCYAPGARLTHALVGGGRVAARRLRRLASTLLCTPRL